MMMVTGSLRVLASGALLLLATTTTTLVQPAGATTSSDLTSAPVTSDSTAVPVTSGDATDAPATSDTADAGTDAPAMVGNSGLCDTEYAACFEDERCQSCITAASSTLQSYACALIDTQTTSTQGCEANADYACCLDEDSEFECLDSDQFVAYFMCVLDDYGCEVDEITCDGDESTGIASASAAATTAGLGDASPAVAFSCAFMALLPLLWV